MSTRRNRSVLALSALALAAIATGCSSSNQTHASSAGFFGHIAAGDSLGLSLGARESTPKAVAAETSRAKAQSQPRVANASGE